MRVSVEINLSDQDHKVLKNNVGSRLSSVRLVERSKIILLAAEGLENRAIAERLNVTPNTVGTWRNRFAEEGIKALEKEKPRGSNHGGKKSTSQRRLRQKMPLCFAWMRKHQSRRWIAHSRVYL